MAFINVLLRTVRFSTSPLSIGRYMNKPLTLKLCDQLSQCRMLTLTHCWRSEIKPTSTETLNLDSWKNILRSKAQSNTDEEESDTQNESTIESMQKLVEMWRLAGNTVPDSMSTEQLQELLKQPTKTSRKRYLRILWHKECRKNSNLRKKLERRALMTSEIKSSTESHSYVLKRYEACEQRFYGWRTAQAMVHGQPLVFDMAYDQYMSQKEMENAISQLMMCEGFNRVSTYPFHIHFCNFQSGGPYHKELLKRYGNAFDNLLITTTEKSHVDIFPRDQLVYLTADSRNVLKEFEHDKIYIVGAFVDKCQKPGVSLGNAKQLKLATARLPLEKYLKWRLGAKNLTLNQVIEILMTLKDTGHWENALSCVPTRKHMGFQDTLLQNNKWPQESREINPQKKTRSDSANQKKSKWWP